MRRRRLARSLTTQLRLQVQLCQPVITFCSQRIEFPDLLDLGLVLQEQRSCPRITCGAWDQAVSMTVLRPDIALSRSPATVEAQTCFHMTSKRDSLFVLLARIEIPALRTDIVVGWRGCLSLRQE